MNILILNWSDIKNPNAGGAELLTHEMAKRWAARGHGVTQLSSEFPGSKKEEIVNDVRIIRKGSPIVRDPHIPVHAAAYGWYRRYGRGKFDVVLDEIHGIPFFTPLYVRERKVALICEVADELWNVTFPFPFNIIGRAIERSYFRLYKNVPFLTISPSTRKDLIAKGVGKEHITVLPMGLTLPDRARRLRKEKDPTLIFVGRISKTKGIDQILEMLNLVRQRVKSVKLWIVGQGDSGYLNLLQRRIRERDLSAHVRFFGFVPQERKFELMARAHLLVAASVKEGWGLIVPEAGYVGTPSVVYDVAGFRDIITDGKNGRITPAYPFAMANAVVELLTSPSLYAKIQTGAQIRAKEFDWDKTAEAALSALQSPIV